MMLEQHRTSSLADSHTHRLAIPRLTVEYLNIPTPTNSGEYLVLRLALKEHFRKFGVYDYDSLKTHHRGSQRNAKVHKRQWSERECPPQPLYTKATPR